MKLSLKNLVIPFTILTMSTLAFATTTGGLTAGTSTSGGGAKISAIILAFWGNAEWVIRGVAAAGALYFGYLILVEGAPDKKTYFAFIALLALFGAYGAIGTAIGNALAV